MANTINWGQAAVDNTIDYGQGATDNTISWGKSQTLSPSGETNITGAGGTPAFTNTLSTTFDGTDDFVDCGNDSSLNFSADDAFSFSVWFKKGSDSGSNTVFSKGLGAINYDGYYMFALADYVYFRIRNNSSNFHQIKDNDTHPLNTWVHYLVTYDGSRSASGGGLKLYKNGTLLTNVSKSGNFSSGSGQTIANFGIGARIIDSAAHFNGNIDEVSAFNSELSASNVTTIYNSGTPNDISAISGLVSWWRMGDGSTYPQINDAVGSNNGTMTNMSAANFVTDVPT